MQVAFNSLSAPISAIKTHTICRHAPIIAAWTIPHPHAARLRAPHQKQALVPTYRALCHVRARALLHDPMRLLQAAIPHALNAARPRATPHLIEAMPFPLHVARMANPLTARAATEEAHQAVPIAAAHPSTHLAMQQTMWLAAKRAKRLCGNLQTSLANRLTASAQAMVAPKINLRNALKTALSAAPQAVLQTSFRAAFQATGQTEEQTPGQATAPEATGQAIKHSAMRPLAQTTRHATPTATAPHPPAALLPHAATSGAVTTSPAPHGQAPRPELPALCHLPSLLSRPPASQHQAPPQTAPLWPPLAHA